MAGPPPTAGEDVTRVTSVTHITPGTHVIRARHAPSGPATTEEGRLPMKHLTRQVPYVVAAPVTTGTPPPVPTTGRGSAGDRPRAGPGQVAE